MKYYLVLEILYEGHVERYTAQSVELRAKGYGYDDPETQGVWLKRFGCSEFIPGQDVLSVRWVECRDDDKTEPVPDPECELVAA